MSFDFATSLGDFAIAHWGNISQSLIFVSRTVVTLYPCFNKLFVRALPANQKLWTRILFMSIIITSNNSNRKIIIFFLLNKIELENPVKNEIKAKNALFLLVYSSFFFMYLPTCPIPIIPIFFCLTSVELFRTLIGATKHFMF